MRKRTRSEFKFLRGINSGTDVAHYRIYYDIIRRLNMRHCVNDLVLRYQGAETLLQPWENDENKRLFYKTRISFSYVSCMFH